MPVLAAHPNLQIEETGGTEVQYLGFNLRDPLLQDARVRQAIACAIDRELIIRTLAGRPCAACAEPAASQPLGLQRRCDRVTTTIRRAPAKLLDEAGLSALPAAASRFHLTMKTSNDEGTRLLAAVLQQQLAAVGIALDIRSYEYATFYSDVTRGAFQMYSLRWIGGNEQPDIFSYAFSTARFSPKGANRSHYSNARLDALLDEAAQSEDTARRRARLRGGAADSGPRSACHQSLVSRHGGGA